MAGCTRFLLLLETKHCKSTDGKQCRSQKEHISRAALLKALGDTFSLPFPDPRPPWSSAHGP
jgi:hypothetical protein